jgi:hypothetical protein
VTQVFIEIDEFALGETNVFWDSSKGEKRSFSRNLNRLLRDLFLNHIVEDFNDERVVIGAGCSRSRRNEIPSKIVFRMMKFTRRRNEIPSNADTTIAIEADIYAPNSGMIS